MNINIASPNRTIRTIELSKGMEDHFNIPINHAWTILEQVYKDMYNRWFEGKKDLVCMDFGANVGLVSLYMLPACKQLHCIEPTPGHHALLTELLLPNKGETDLVIYKSALSGSEGQVQFATGHATENKITSTDGYGNNKITVEGHTLSWFVGDKTVDFCKVDIEGGEMIALTIEELKKVYGKVKTFFVEVHPAFNGGMDENREELIKRFQEAGYKIEIIDYQTILAYEG